MSLNVSKLQTHQDSLITPLLKRMEQVGCTVYGLDSCHCQDTNSDAKPTLGRKAEDIDCVQLQKVIGAVVVPQHAQAPFCATTMNQEAHPSGGRDVTTISLTVCG